MKTRTWFFEEKENKKKLLDSVNRWRGAKYFHMGSAKNGIDCTKLMGSIMIELGSLKQLIPDLEYPKDWYRHSEEEVVLNTFEEHLRLYQVRGFKLHKFKYYDKFELKFGDFLGFAYGSKGGLTNHTSVLLDKNLFHVIYKMSAIETEFTEGWRKRITFVYRLFLEV